MRARATNGPTLRAGGKCCVSRVEGYTSQAIGAKTRHLDTHGRRAIVQIMEKDEAESVAVLVRQAIRLGIIEA